MSGRNTDISASMEDAVVKRRGRPPKKADSTEAAPAEEKPKRTRAKKADAEVAPAEDKPKRTRTRKADAEVAPAEEKPKRTRAKKADAEVAPAEEKPKRARAKKADAVAAPAEDKPKRTRTRKADAEVAPAEEKPKRTRAKKADAEVAPSEDKPKRTRAKKADAVAAPAEDKPKRGRPPKKAERVEENPAESSKTPQVMRLVRQDNDMINPTILAGKSSIPRRLRGLEPLTRIMKREAEEIFDTDEDAVTYNITALVIADHAAEILRRFNACDCEVCVEELSRLTAEIVPARFAKLRPRAVERNTAEVAGLKEPLKRKVTAEMIRLVIRNKKRSYHD